MASINASTSGAGGVITTADNTGTLNLQSGGTTIATINSTGLSMASGKVLAPTGPAFSAYQSSAQSISHNSFTKVQFQTENFDTNSNFDNTTNYRYTPTVAGYYFVDARVAFNSLSQNSFSQILKNGGSESNSPTAIPWAGISNSQSTASVLVYMNGSTDYLEVWAYQASGGALSLIVGTNITAFSAFLARAA
jgi:hypothetical protein